MWRPRAVTNGCRFLAPLAIGNLGTVDHADRLQGLIGRAPSAAIDAYHHARYWAGTSSDAADRDLYDSVAPW